MRDLESLREKLAALKLVGADETLLRTTAAELRVIEDDLRGRNRSAPGHLPAST